MPFIIGLIVLIAFVAFVDAFPAVFLTILAVGIGFGIKSFRDTKKYYQLRTQIISVIGNDNWSKISADYDITVSTKSKQAMENYDEIKFFKERPNFLEQAANIIELKHSTAEKIKDVLNNQAYQSQSGFNKVQDELRKGLSHSGKFIIRVEYKTPSGKKSYWKDIHVSENDINRLKRDPSLLMGKTEYNRYLKELEKQALENRRTKNYDLINEIIESANTAKKQLEIQCDIERLDKLIADLLRAVVGNIDKIKSSDSQSWDLIEQPINEASHGVKEIIDFNEKLSTYYRSDDFAKVKKACENLINSQKEFNDYIREKLAYIAEAFGSKVEREQTTHEDQYSRIRPYQKTISPFTAEVSSQVFSSAENAPMKYVVKWFYPNTKEYPVQIQRLYKLVEELETLQDAKKIIENYKAEYTQYLAEVPAFVMDNDESGFYSRLGFAVVNESALVIKYVFSYTSAGGMAQRSFSVPMTIEAVCELIKALESKLTAKEFAKKQRLLMTSKLRQLIKERDNFTCCNCGNSINIEPNLLLEIDHIVPVSKGGETIESNLQTLCWKCNRQKAAKLFD